MTKSFTLYWTSADRQGVMDGGTYATRAAAEAAIAAVKAEFLAQCASAEQIADIEAGVFDIVEIDD